MIKKRKSMPECDIIIPPQWQRKGSIFIMFEYMEMNYEEQVIIDSAIINTVLWIQ